MAKDKPITIYGTRYTEEEQKAANERFLNEQSPLVDVYAQEEQALTPEQPSGQAVQTPVVQTVNNSYWAQPENIVKQYDYYRANPNEPKPENVPAQEEVSAAFDYLSTINKGKPKSEWVSLSPNDAYWNSVISKWPDPTQPQTPEAEATISNVEKLSQPKEMQGTFQELSPARKADVVLVPTGTITEGEPGFAKWSRGLISGLGSATPGYLAGELGKFVGTKVLPKLAGPLGWLPTIGSIASAGFGYYTAVTGKDVPESFKKVQNYLDIFGQGGEKVLIGMPATIKALHPEIDTNDEFAWNNAPQLPGANKAREFLTDVMSGENVKDAFDNILDVTIELGKMAAGQESALEDINWKAAWTTGGMGLEENPLTNVVDNLINRLSGEPVAKRGEYFRSELGINEPVPSDLTTDEAYRAVYNAVVEKMKLVNPNTGEPYTLREIEDELVLPFATAQYGISGAKSDIINQEVLDITNYMPFMANVGAKAVGKVTNNPNLVQAAEINTISKGGLTELADAYKEVLRGELSNVKVDSLSQMDRVNANLTPEGTFAELQPGQATGKFAWIKNLSQLTEESKAEFLYKDTIDMISEISLMSGSLDALNNNIMKMADLLEIPENDPLSVIHGTAAQKTVSDSLRAIVESGAINNIADKWYATENLRNNLTVISSQLEVTPDEFIKMVGDRPDAVKALIKDYAAANNNMIMNQVLADDGTNILDQFKVFTDKKNPLPYRMEQITAEYTKEIADKLSDYIVNLYGIKQQNLAIRLSDMLKKMQSTMLLGFSPSYAANNLINDLSTRAAEGIFGFPNADLWVSRMAITPARMYESMAAFRGGNEKASSLTTLKERIKSKQRADDVVDKISDLMSKANSKTPATKLSGNIEAAESARANVVGQMQYMYKMWKIGKGFDEMNAGLASRIESQIPNSSRLIYTAIQNGINPQEIESYLYGDYVKPNVQNILDGIVKDTLDADTVIELFGKTNVLPQLQSLLDNAATPEERARAVDYVRENMSGYAKLFMDNQLMADAENTRNDVIASGDTNQRLLKSMEYMSYMAISRADQWLRTRDSYAGAYAKKLQKSMNSVEWKNYISSISAQNRAQWETYNAREQQVYAGILRGLGFNNDISLRYSNLVLDYQANWEDFYAIQKQKINEYYDGQLTWEDYLADTDQAYEDHFQTEMQIQENMNSVFLQGYYDSIGLDITPLKTLMDQIIVIRHDMHDMQIDIRDRTRNMNDEMRNEAYLEFEPLYNAKIQQIADLQSQIGATLSRDPVELRREQSGSPVQEADPIQAVSDFERAAAILRTNEKIKEANTVRDQAEADFQDVIDNGRSRFPEFESRLAATTDYFETSDVKTLDNYLIEHKADFTIPEWKQIYKHYSESYFDVDKLNIATRIREKIFDGRFDNTATSLSREQIRQEFVNAGISQEQVDFNMALYDARAEQWERENPGKNFYTEALRIREITREADRTNKFLSQVEQITDIDTPKFKKFFEGSKVVNPDGSPKIVYHGSPNDFDTFSYKYMGTSGTSEGYGFYFSDSPEIANNYSRGSGNIYESYINIKKPISSDNKFMTRSDVKKLLKAIDKADMASSEPGHWFLSDYGDIENEGFQNVLNSATNLIFDNNDNDLDIVSEIINTSDPERVYRALRESLGYDGVITKYPANEERGEVNIYIPFLPEQVKSIYNVGEFDPNNPNMLYQTYTEAAAAGSPWYSHLETVIADKFPDKMKVESVRNWLLRQGVSTEELRWSGIDDFFLSDEKDQVTKADLQAALESNKFVLEEIKLGGDYSKELRKKYLEIDKDRQNYYNKGNELIKSIDNLPLSFIVTYHNDPSLLTKYKGSETYTEIVNAHDQFVKIYPDYFDQYNKLKTEADTIYEELKTIESIYDKSTTRGDYTNYRELIITLPDNELLYKSGHWENINNPLFHIRFDDRIDSKGRRILYIEEFQSDWIQDIQKGKNVPDVPFKNVWERKAVQRMMNYAAQNGYDMVAWTPGKVQMERWSLGTIADEIEVRKKNDTEVYLLVSDKGTVIAEYTLKTKELADYIGKERTNRILNSQEYKVTGEYVISEEEMAIGETWPLKVYDEDIVNATKKVVKKYGSDIETVTIDAGEEGLLEAPAYKVTPEMKEPQRLFQALQDKIKGQFEVIDGDSAIRIFSSGDVSTMVHETGHAFRRTLNDLQMEDFSKWAGFESAETFRDLDNRYWNDFKNLTDEEKKRYTETEEKFARGWEQYLIEGKAPTPKLQVIFEAFTNWLLDIYKTIKNVLTKDYSEQHDFIFDGKPLDIKAEINGVKLKDIFDSMLTTKEVRGTTTTANGIIDPATRYEFQYKIMELSDVNSSHKWVGDRLISNNMYNKLLQPRSREQQQSVQQINKMAANLSPDLLLLESHSLDRGAPIIGRDNNIESGNGRMLALLRAKERYPSRWAEYQQALLSEINNYGISPESLSEFKNPVLVRERITEIDRSEFVREANKPVALQMTAQENAMNDAQLINDVALSNLDILDNETIEGAIEAKRNADFVQSFMNSLSENEAAQYYYKNKDGNFVLNENGRRRIINALFAKVYGQAGDSLLQSFTMSTESNIRLLESALKDSLPQMARIEGMISRGIRPAEYSIANDIAVAANKLISLRDSKINVEEYLNQATLPGLSDNLTPSQKMFLQYFSEQRSAKKIRQLVREYANLIYNMPDTSQTALFDLPQVTKEELIELAFNKIGEDNAPALFQTADEALFAASAQEQYMNGDPISIEQLKQVALPIMPEAALVGDPQSLEIKPDEFISNEVYAKRVAAYQLENYLITANVYKGAQLIALYTNDLPMKEIPFNGKLFDVLGIDPDNNNAYVFFDGENVITIDPQNIPDLSVDDQPTVPQGGKNQVPLTMPTGEAYAELMSKYVNPILNQFLPRYEAELLQNKTAKSFNTLDTQTKVDLERYLDDVRSRLAATKYNAIKYGEMKRDQALLNYNKRYGFDTFLTIVSPYQFWYTRSMLNWAKRMIDRPIWFTTYARLKEKEELFARDDFPTRLEGRAKINMPYLEDWMGGSVYVDLLSQLFPFAQFIKKAEQQSKDKNILVKKTETLLKDQLNDGIINNTEYLEALKNQNNSAWKAAYAEVSDKNNIDPTIGGLFQQYLSLPFLADWALKKYQGREGDIYNLPITRTGLTLQTLTKNTPLELPGELAGGALTLPEQGLRKLYGIDYNELGSYGDYAIRKQISQMGNAGEISRQEMLDAQRSMSGEIYEEAYRRQREELMLRTQSAPAIDAMVEYLKGNASFTDVLQTLFIVPFSSLVYPEDEAELRKQSEELNEAYAAKADGSNPNAVSEFYDKHPAYVGRTASFKDTDEELNKYVAYQNITNEYYSKSYADQVATIDALGPDFYNAIVNKETKNYAAVPYEDLLTWEYALRGDIPNLPASEINKNIPTIRYFTPQVSQAVDEWEQYKDQTYPNIDAIQDQYYANQKENRKQYLNLHPELVSYWEDKRQFEAQHPEFQAFEDIRSGMYDEIMAANSYSEMEESVINDLEYSTITGAQLRSASKIKLQYLYEKYANPNFDTFEEFVEKLKHYK